MSRQVSEKDEKFRLSPTSGHILVLQVPQTETLDQQEPHSQGHQAIITEEMNSPKMT